MMKVYDMGAGEAKQVYDELLKARATIRELAEALEGLNKQWDRFDYNWTAMDFTQAQFTLTTHAEQIKRARE